MQRSVGRAFFAWILFCVATATYADAVTDRAAALLKRQDAQGAYALLLPLASQRAGDPAFD